MGTMGFHDRVTMSYLLAIDLARAIKFNDEQANMLSSFLLQCHAVVNSGLDGDNAVAGLEALNGTRSSSTPCQPIVSSNWLQVMATGTALDKLPYTTSNWWLSSSSEISGTMLSHEGGHPNAPYYREISCLLQSGDDRHVICHVCTSPHPSL